ncbi:TonB-dependent copper receptor [Ottowia sp. VDI28]|uniref:TonB-dependent copper receptor n=1 Tax=Ottowia sp. VDI28 TaxID=3133968 RepID=UPI003C2E23B8
MRISGPALAVACVSFMVTLPLLAMANQDASEASDLSEVVVTSVHARSPVQVVTDPRQPRQPIPASDAADYLKTVPGFSAIRSGGANSDPVFRGQFGSRLPILTNGSTLLGACGSRMDAPSSYISPDTYDLLTVIKGPQTVIWGPGASAGVVRFDRLPPAFVEPGVHFSASLLGATGGRHDQTAELEAGNSRMYLRGTTNHSQAQDYKDGSSQRIHSGWKKWNADLALGFTPDTRTLLELSAGMGNGHARYASRSMDGARFRRESWGVRFEKKNINAWLTKLEAQAYANHIDHVMDNYSLRPFTPSGGMAMLRASNVQRTTTGGRLAATLQPKASWQLITGFDAQRSPLDWRGGTLASPYQERPWIAEAKLSDLGWFGEASWQATQRTRWVGGLRLDHAKARRYPTGASDHRSRSALPSAFIRWEQQRENGATVYAGLGHVQRFPDYWELIPPGNSASGRGNAFITLKPEKTTQLDLGAHWTGEGWQLWASGYAGVVKDYILFDHAGPRSAVRNVDAVTIGFELGGQCQLASSWKAQATVAGTWSRNRTDGRPLPQIPPSELRVGLDYAEGPWSAGGLWRVVSAQRRYAVGQGNAVGKDFGASSGFGVLSLHASYRLHAKFKLLAGVDNVFNKTYAEHLNLAGNAGFGFPGQTRINEPGRTVWLRADMRFY